MSAIALATMPPIRCAIFGVQHGGGRFFQHLLVAPLERTVALAQMDRIAIAVAKHLEFDMARIAEIFFEIDGVIAEGRLGLVACLLDQRF